jgi:hypothetical protein
MAVFDDSMTAFDDSTVLDDSFDDSVDDSVR